MAGRKTVATNRRARHDYEILDTYEAGIQLTGSEVKSLRAGQVQLKDGFAVVRDGELWLEKVHIAPYSFSRAGGHDPERPRKLLMHRREIDRLAGKMQERGLTLVPLSIYFTHGLAKVELGLAKGKRTRDKRRDLIDRQQRREMDRARRRR
ncbi:MAG TPA: SsrA-binding protein SmpB [Actinobacteria bacterium]|nr:SsrA-binding protein SmpB [Actinomycetota bacterium]